MNLQQRLLALLADGRFHSGEALGAALGVSRAAVWKQIRALRDLGLELQGVRGRGYRCPRPLELLSADAVRAAVSDQGLARLGGLEIHARVDSTNTHLQRRALAGAPGGTACLAESQLAGRGRRGRRWISPFGTNLYLSLLWRFSASPEGMSGLSLAVGVGVLRALRELGVEEVGLKWPNDVLCCNAKVAGILIDMAGESSGPGYAVIGVGLNLSMPRAAAAAIDQPWADLQGTLGATVSRNRLAGRLIDHLLAVTTTFQETGLGAFMEDWRRYDLLAGRTVRVLLPDREVAGEAGGIDATGALVLNAGGRTHRFASGEVSLRAVP